jgi:hypothetical protein
MLACLLLASGCRRPNHAPGTAVVPQGERFTFVGNPTAVWSNVEDIDDDSVAIRFTWGDGDTSDWSDYFPERGWTALSHAWAAVGTYMVSAQARDKRGASSVWSDGRTTYVIPGWARTFGGDKDDIGRSVQQTQDDGYIIAGLTNSRGSVHTDAWLIKTNAYGDTIWTRTYGSTDADWANTVCQTADGGYIIAGGTGGNCEIWLLKTDASGNAVWSRTYGGSSGYGGDRVVQTRDGGYIVVGSTTAAGAGSSDIWLLRLDPYGDTTWTRTYGSTSLDQGCSVQQTQDGGYAALGSKGSLDSGWFDTDIWLIKTDANGDTIWTRTFGARGEDDGFCAQQTQDGGYIITGRTTSGGPYGYGVCLIKTDASGNTAWIRSFGGPESSGRSVRQTHDGGYVVGGINDAAHLLIIKTDDNGDTLWTRHFGWGGVDGGNCVQQTRDGAYIIAGSTSSYGSGMEDVWLIRVESDSDVSGPSSLASEK